jgi:hypothetical protein
MPRKNKKGSILIMSLIIFGIIVVTSLSVALTTLRSAKTSMQASKTNIAYQNADEGVDRVMTEILKGAKNSDGNSVITIASILDGNKVPGTTCCTGGTTNDDKIVYGTVAGTVCNTNRDEFIVSLYNAAGNPITNGCNATVDISRIAQLRAVGNDNNTGTQRIVEANVQQKDSKVRLLLHMDAALASSNVVVDNSRSHHVVSVPNNITYGNASLPSITPNYSYASFNGTNQYLSISDNGVNDWKNLSIGSSSPFTIDFWANFNGDTANATRTFFQLRHGAGADSLILSYNPSGTRTITLTRSGSTSLTCTFNAGTTDFPSNGWVHIALVENISKDFKLFLGGKKKDFAAACKDDGNININQMIIGNTNGTSNYFSGYMDEFRFYTAAVWNDTFDTVCPISAVAPATCSPY